MSRLQRALAKAEEEGLLTWTGGDHRSARASMVAEAEARVPAHPTTAPRHHAIEPAQDPIEWSPAYETTAVLSPLFVAANDPGSPAAEQYRLLRTRLEGREQGRRSQLIVVTSPLIGDGKTITSANLALTMAQEYQHTVALVEADLRRPSLATLMGIRPEPGLVDVLVGAATLEEALVSVPAHNLTVLPAGVAAGRAAELLASSAMSSVADTLRARFNRIVIDTPPVTLADTHVLARLADGVLFVVRSGVTPTPALEHALEGLDRSRVMGVVLNAVDATENAYTYGVPQTGRFGE
jgi:capsular exopolysaccharide synthesis family protein